MRSDTFKIYALTSIGGLTAVILGGVLGGILQYVFWSLVILLDLAAGYFSGKQGGFSLFLEHFAERHGLFVIITLGEILILAMAGISGKDIIAELATVAILGIFITSLLWWSYFATTKPLIEAEID